MQSIKDAAAEFLADKRIAVTGVSRTPRTHGSNNVYRRPALRQTLRRAPGCRPAKRRQTTAPPP